MYGDCLFWLQMDRRSALHASARRQRAAARATREADPADDDMIPEQTASAAPDAPESSRRRPRASRSRRQQGAGPTIAPLLTCPAPGGPRIPDLLLGFEGHIAHAIWAGMVSKILLTLFIVYTHDKFHKIYILIIYD